MTFAFYIAGAGRRSLKLRRGRPSVRHSASGSTHDGLAPDRPCSNHRCRPACLHRLHLGHDLGFVVGQGLGQLGENAWPVPLSSVQAWPVPAPRTWRGRTASRGCPAHRSSATATCCCRAVCRWRHPGSLASSLARVASLMPSSSRDTARARNSPSESQRRWFSLRQLLHVLRCRAAGAGFSMPPPFISGTMDSILPRCPVP